MLRLHVTEVLAPVRRVGDVVVPIVRQRDVTGAQFVIGLEQREIRADDIPVLDPDRRHQLAASRDPLEVVRRVRDLDPVRIHLLCHPVDRVELDHRVRLRLRVVLRGPLGLAHVDDEERRVEPTLFHLHQIDLPTSPDAGVNLRCGEVERDVVVGIDGQHPVVDAAGSVDERRLPGGGVRRDLRRRVGAAAGRRQQPGERKPADTSPCPFTHQCLSPNHYGPVTL